MTAFYFLVGHQDGAPDIYGPYLTGLARDVEAVEMYSKEPDFIGPLSRLDIVAGIPQIIPYPSKFFSQIFAKKIRVEIEGGKVFEGYTDGLTWNDWQRPRFTREVAEKAIACYNGGDGGYEGYAFPDTDADIMIDPDTGKALVLFELGGWCWDEADPVPEDKDALHHFQFWWKFTDTLAIDVRMTREERDAFAQDIDPDEIQRWCENHPERVINISDPIKDPGDCDCDIEEFED